jgi:hypothetical protein
MDRNVRDHDEINVKPHYTTKFDKSEYKPNKHLNARQDYSQTIDVVSGASNMHLNKVMNMKKSVADQQKNMHGTL